MYNRYQGNTGRFVRVPDPPAPERRPMSVPARNVKRPPPAPGSGLGNLLGGLGGGLGNILPLDNIRSALGGILPNALADGLETEDLILLLVLYLMYKESGDKELLIMLGAMFLL